MSILKNKTQNSKTKKQISTSYPKMKFQDFLEIVISDIEIYL